MPTTLTEQQLEVANRFTDRMTEALTESGLPSSDWVGFILGWVYGQLRQRMSREEARDLIVRSVAKCEEALDNVAES
jgi:hypothetical protein